MCPGPFSQVPWRSFYQTEKEERPNWENPRKSGISGNPTKEDCHKNKDKLGRISPNQETPPSEPPPRQSALDMNVGTSSGKTKPWRLGAMTTKFLKIKLHFQNLIGMALPMIKKKNSIFGRFSYLPPMPSPHQKYKYYFSCRLAVSERCWSSTPRLFCPLAEQD